MLKKKHPLFNIYHNIKQRVNNQNSKAYKNYGGRGISISTEWNTLDAFIKDMYPSYRKGLTIDRIDNDGDYCKENCRWATRSVQARNTRVIKSINTSGYRGVSFVPRLNKWMSCIMVNSKTKHIGTFNSSIDAAKAYDKYVIDNKLEHTINNIME